VKREARRYVVNQPTYTSISNLLATLSVNWLVYEIPGVLGFGSRPGIHPVPSPAFASRPDSTALHVRDTTILPLVTRFTGGLCASGNRMMRHPCYTQSVYIGAATDMNHRIVRLFGTHRVADGRLNCGRPLPRNCQLEANDSAHTLQLPPLATCQRLVTFATVYMS